MSSLWCCLGSHPVGINHRASGLAPQPQDVTLKYRFPPVVWCLCVLCSRERLSPASCQGGWLVTRVKCFWLFISISQCAVGTRSEWNESVSFLWHIIRCRLPPPPTEEDGFFVVKFEFDRFRGNLAGQTRTSRIMTLLLFLCSGRTQHTCTLWCAGEMDTLVSPR